MSERTQAEIEAALTAYHGADGWDHNDRADMRAALVAADAVAPPDARIEALEAALREAQELLVHMEDFLDGEAHDLERDETRHVLQNITLTLTNTPRTD